MTTGTAWFYSSGGQKEWRFLSANSDLTPALLVGDFDGDGRSDVVTLRNGKILISWGGLSKWEVLNAKPFDSVSQSEYEQLGDGIFAQMAVGDFDGDGRADLFWSDGHTWRVSYGGTEQFVPVQTSRYKVDELMFGDFDGNATTDVFGVVSGQWMVSLSSKARGSFKGWSALGPALWGNVADLWVGDFDGDGKADVAKWCGEGCWAISYGGTSNWKSFTLGSYGPDVVQAGKFEGKPGADLLVWKQSWDSFPSVGSSSPSGGAWIRTLEIWIAVQGVNSYTQYAPQDMR